MAASTEPSDTDLFWERVILGWKNKAKGERARWSQYANLYRTNAHPRSDGNAATGLEVEDAVLVESNWAYAFADTLTANVVPSNPALTVKSNRQALDQNAKLRSMLVNKIFQKEKMHNKLWAQTVRASVWPRAWMKAVWSNKLGRPILRVINPHYIFFDTDAESEDDMRYVIEVSVISKGELVSRVKRQGKRGGFYRSDCLEDLEFGKWPQWVEPDDEWSDQSFSENAELDLVRDAYEWCTVYEVYDLVGRKFYHYADGVQRPLFEGDLPYEYLANPFKMLWFNDNLEDAGGMSDVELVKPTIDRMNEMDTLEMGHLKSTTPTTIVHTGLLDDPGDFLDALLAVDSPGMAVQLDARPNAKISDVIGATPMPMMDPNWTRARQNLEGIVQFVLGLPSYSRGETGKADIATELALTDTATRTRNAKRQRAIYDVIEWAGASIISLYQQFMDPDSTIPIRVSDTDAEEELTRELLGFGDENGEDPWGWEYEAHPYTAAEANDVVQLKQLETYIPLLQIGIQMGVIDVRRLFKKLLELLHMPGLLADPKEQAAMQQPPAGPGAPPTGQQGPPPPAGPGGISSMMPPEAQPAMQGGDIGQGTGDANSEMML